MCTCAVNHFMFVSINIVCLETTLQAKKIDQIGRNAGARYDA